MTALKAKLSAYPLPRLWLMTDERISTDRLLGSAERLPRGAGIVFRHYSLPPRKRRALFMRLQERARRRGVMLLLAGPPSLATAWRADGWHGHYIGQKVRRMIHSAPAHSPAELEQAARSDADLVFLSPVFATHSHPGAGALGRARFGLLARSTRLPVVALGGMTPKRAAALHSMGIHGWAAIDYWMENPG
jgi:thiamine-phosphate pyrophosphorylase